MASKKTNHCACCRFVSVHVVGGVRPYTRRSTLNADPEILELIEKAYRRGYAHAAYWAVEASTDRLGHSVLVEWLKAVTDWRSGFTNKYKHKRCPPEPWNLKHVPKWSGG